PNPPPTPTNPAKTTPSASASHTHTLCQRGPIFTAKYAPTNAPNVLHHQSSTEVRPTENTYWQTSMPRLSRAAIHTARHTGRFTPKNTTTSSMPRGTKKATLPT